MKYQIQIKSRISRRSSCEMILLFANYGNHPFNIFFNSYNDLKENLIKQGINIDIAEACRDYRVPVPIYENVIGSTWTFSGRGTVSRVHIESSEEDLNLQEPGTITHLGYWGIFESACEGISRSIAETCYQDIQSAIVKGIASIESYLNHRAFLWNKINSEDKLIDSRAKKISLDDKIDLWIPKMTGGKKLDKSGINWQDFKVLRLIRDDKAIHPKESGYAISYKELAGLINKFRTGIAGVIVQLHQLFEEKIPSVIIRAKYKPEAEVIAIPISNVDVEAR